MTLPSHPPIKDRDPIFYGWAVVFFAIQVALQFLLLKNAPPPFPPLNETLVWTAGGVLAIFGIPFGLLLPTIKANGMASRWGVPQATFLLSRPLARFICSAGVGSAIGGIFLLPLAGFQYFALLVATSVVAGCLAFATHRRFQAHRCTEWTMPNPWYKLLRPIIRGSRLDA